MQCFARMVRAIMGASVLNKDKLESGVQLDVLGLTISYDQKGVQVRVNQKKAEQWSQQLVDALGCKTRTGGEAGRVADRLSFAAQKTLKQIGRATLRPIFRQQYKPLSGSRIGRELGMAMKWRLHALTDMQAQTIAWNPSTSKATLLTDARGSPPRVAAVVVMDGQFWYTDWEPDSAILSVFNHREDAQVMGSELLAIAVGLCTFGQRMKEMSVRVFCDNAGGEHALAAGAAKSDDHNVLIHSMWMVAMKLGLWLWVERDGKKDNITDLPSRESYDLLEKLGASWVPPKLSEAFYHPQTAFQQLAGEK